MQKHNLPTPMDKQYQGTVFYTLVEAISEAKTWDDEIPVKITQEENGFFRIYGHGKLVWKNY